MIKKSILVCAVLLCLHAAWVARFPDRGMPTHQFQDNVVKVQRFLYAESPYALVGTSLSARILKDSIPEVASIAFGGSSVKNGLRLVLFKPEAPRVLFVETNLLLRESDAGFIDRALAPFPYAVKRVVPSLREQYQPICLFADLMLGATGVNPQQGAATVNREFLERCIEDALAADTVSPPDRARGRMERVASLLSGIEAKGTRLVFFEMPVHPRLEGLASFGQVRELVEERFPRTRYAYVPRDTAAYLTTDGMHLDYDGQCRFSGYFRSCIRGCIGAGDGARGAGPPGGGGRGGGGGGSCGR